MTWRWRARLGDLFPGLFGMSRRAAWRRFLIRRTVAMALVTVGVAVAFSAGVMSSPATG
ncbi:MAG TPA: hypothetical protein GXZ60_10885 [Intrasporangiaceae bacterium]|nr:hypothetical protein [Intrasporangiaceae bacterium]